MSRVVALFEQYVKLSNNLHYDAMVAAVRVEDPGRLADTISAHLLVGVDEKQNLLEIISPIERLNRIAGILEAEVDKLQVDRRIQSRVKKQMEKAQKEYYLNEKMKAIQKELGRKDEKGNEVDESEEEDRSGPDAEGRRGKGHPGAEAARSDAADVGRGHGLAQLSRLAHRRSLVQEDPREPRPQARRGDPQHRPLRAGEDQGPHPRVPRGARPGEEAEGARF